MLKMFTFLMTVILFVACLSGSAYSGDKDLVLKKYPTLKIGFTTQNFAKVLSVSLENTKKLIDYAAAQGFPWIELRDPNALGFYFAPHPKPLGWGFFCFGICGN